MFAMLLEMTSTLRCCAIMPVAAVERARIISAPAWKGKGETGATGSLWVERSTAAAQAINRAALEVAGRLVQLGGLLIGPVQLHQPGHLDDRVDVGSFHRSLDESGVERRQGDLIGRRAQHAVAEALEAPWVVELEDSDLAEDQPFGRDRPVGRDIDQVSLFQRQDDLGPVDVQDGPAVR